jgi:O-methyltransferase involved in polyketide biosynthesis
LIWTAVRTKFINDTITDWVNANEGKKVQVTNMGCGVDTRAFWLDSLKNAERYVEVDVKSINSFKAKKLAEIKAEPLCPRLVINMDFS